MVSVIVGGGLLIILDVFVGGSGCDGNRWLSVFRLDLLEDRYLNADQLEISVVSLAYLVVVPSVLNPSVTVHSFNRSRFIR